jgi:heme/copper-type cytochrome/quinol oxidase subunit 2
MAFLSIGTVIFFIVGFVFNMKAKLDRDAGRDESYETNLKIACITYTVGGVITILCLLAIFSMMASL